MSGLDLAAVASLFASRSRAAMLDLLLDGREHAVGALARAATVAPSTALEHLGRLEQGGLVVSRRDGRERLVRLSRPAVAAAHEALSQLVDGSTSSGLRDWHRREALRVARTCYDHLAGRLGVAVTDAALTAGALADDFSLGPSATAWFGRLGVDVGGLAVGRRPLLRVCTDWTERRPHLAGALGAAVCSAVLAAGWVERRPATRALRLTRSGVAELARLGVEV